MPHYFTLGQLKGTALSLTRAEDDSRRREEFEFSSTSDPYAGTGDADRWYGEPPAEGLERSGFDVPEGMVIESPGGTSAIHHHWTGGFYGAGGVSPGVYGNSLPSEVYGQMGGMYAKGTPPSFQYYARPPERRPPPRETYSDGIARVGPIPDQGVIDLNPPADEKEAIEGFRATGRKKVSTAIPSDPSVENFSLVHDLTSLEKKSARHPAALLLGLILLGVTLALWNSAVTALMSGEKATRPAIMALLASVLTVGVVNWVLG